LEMPQIVTSRRLLVSSSCEQTAIRPRFRLRSYPHEENFERNVEM
jgi:hypothetical protein